jgi:hypothetical protein
MHKINTAICENLYICTRIMKEYPILAYISIVSPIIPISAGIYISKKTNREIKILLALLVFGFIIDIFSLWRLHSYPQFGPILVHIYILFNYILVMIITYSWQESPRVKILLKTIIVLYIVFWFITKFTFEPMKGLYYFTANVSNVIVILSTGYTLFIVVDKRVQPLLTYQRFWILLSFVLYNTGTLMPAAIQGLFTKLPRSDVYLIWSINWIVAILSNVLFTIGFLCPQTRQ